MTIEHSLEADYYTNSALYTAERERIFKPAWWLLGPVSECEQPGQYLSDTVCSWPVFAIRAKDGVLRGFHNVCRHRGAELLPNGAGRCATIKCPYHAWGYDAVGRLIATPGFSKDNSFSVADYGLLPIRVEQWRGMVFVCLSDYAPDFRDWIGTLDSLMSDFPDVDEMDYHDKFVVDGNANWKTYCDNTVEGYHLHAVHPRLANAISAGSVDIVPYDEGRLVAFHVDYGGEGAGLRGNKGLWAYKFPGFQIAVSNNAFKIERVEATSINTTRSVNWGWYRNLSGDEIRDSFEWSETVVREDLGICESVQKNLEAGIYVNGPLSPVQETNVALFQSIVRAELAS